MLTEVLNIPQYFEVSCAVGDQSEVCCNISTLAFCYGKRALVSSQGEHDVAATQTQLLRCQRFSSHKQTHNHCPPQQW